MKHNKIYIYGKHALEEALAHAPQAILKVFLEPKAADAQLQKIIQHTGIPTAPLLQGMQRSDMRSGTAHQGIIAQLSVHQLVVPYEQFVGTLAPTPNTALVLLCGVQDPHNTGAIIRSAAGFGAAGVLMPGRGQAPVTGAVVKVSAGMAFRIPLVAIEDIYKTISDLKKRGFRVYALTGEGSRSVAQESFDAPAVFVFGNESDGIPPAMRAVCDAVLSVPTNPRCESLNVAASAAVALFAWSVRHPKALQ